MTLLHLVHKSYNNILVDFGLRCSIRKSYDNIKCPSICTHVSTVGYSFTAFAGKTLPKLPLVMMAKKLLTVSYFILFKYLSLNRE